MESQSDALALTRVLSPTMNPSEGILSGVRATCQVCQQMTYEPTICANCGRFGHPTCLGREQFFDFHFCSQCILQVTAEYATFQDAQRRESWRQSLMNQVITWRSRAIEASGLTSTIGVTVGSVVATAAGAAAGLAHGAVRGAVQVASAPRSQLPMGSMGVPVLENAAPPPPPGQDIVPVRRRRARSQDLMTESNRGHCVACWTRNPGHRAHLYRGDCIGLSGQRVWVPTPPGNRANPGQGGPPSGQTPGQPRPLPILPGSGPPGTDATGVAVPDSQESLYTSVASVSDDPRGSPPRPADGATLGQGEDRATRG